MNEIATLPCAKASLSTPYRGWKWAVVLALQLLAGGCTLVEGNEDAAALYERQLQGDAGALDELQVLAKQGKSSAAFYAGLAYDRSGDKTRALNFYAQSESKIAKHNAAIILMQQIQSGQAGHEAEKSMLTNLNEAAEGGLPESMLLLAKIYERGFKSTKADPGLSFQWYRKLVEHNKSPEGEYYLGLAYWNGFGVNRNEDQGRRYLESAAKFGSPEAKIAMYRISSGFDRLVWLLICLSADPSNSKLLENEDLKRFDDYEIRKAKEKSLAWINAHSTDFIRLGYDRAIFPHS